MQYSVSPLAAFGRLWRFDRLGVRLLESRFLLILSLSKDEKCTCIKTFAEKSLASRVRGKCAAGIGRITLRAGIPVIAQTFQQGEQRAAFRRREIGQNALAHLRAEQDQIACQGLAVAG